MAFFIVTAVKTSNLTFFAFVRYGGDSTMRLSISHAIVFKKAYPLFGKEILYNILIEFGVSMKLVWLIKMCLNEMCSKAYIGKHLSDNFPV
jgi:hypothetical protein